MTTTQGGGDPYPTVVDGEEEPFALSLLRSSCDACWKKKCKCSGELPCQRCERSGGNCQYSTKRRLGRPRGAAAKLEGGGAGKRKTTALFDGGNDSALAKAPFAAAPVTGLGGLLESRFLSAFFEHFTPMFPVADEVSIRDGLMHSFAGMWHGGAPTLHGQEASRGRTLECAFLSSVAIGGLLSGQPPEAMASHVESAQASAASCRGLSNKHASSALVLSGMMNLLLPGERSSAAGRRCLDEAEAIFEALPEREPLVAAILTFRRQVESLALIDAATLCPPPRSPPTSSSDGSASAAAAASAAGSSRKPPRKVVAPPRASSSSPEAGGAGASGGDVSSAGGGKGLAVAAASASAAAAGDGEAHTDEGRSILAGVDVVRRDSKCAPLTAQPAHPSFVVADALLLTVRFMRGGGTGGISQLRHVHDFVASELNRLVPARAGALVLISLAGTLLAIKTRLQLTDGMLPMAELTTAMLTKCPGWGRSYGRHAAHLALAVFRLHGHRHSYDTLRDLVRKTSDDPIPSFDDSGGGCGGHACGLGACRVLSESLSTLLLPGTGDDAARGGTGGGTVSSSGSRKSSRKRPGEPRPPSSPGGGGGGGNADAKRQKRASSSSKSVSASARKRPAEVSAAKPASSTKPDAAVTAIAGEAASAGKLPPSRKNDAANSTPPAASAAISSSPTYSSSGVPSSPAFPAEAAAAASSSPSTADVAAAAAAVASATAFAVAAAGTTAAPAQSSDRPPTSAPSFGDARFEAAAGRCDRVGGGSSGDGSVASSEDASSLGRPAAAAVRAWGAPPPGEAGGGSFLGGFSGTNFDGAAAGYGGPTAAARNHHLQHNSHLPVAVSGYPSHYAAAATSGRGDLGGSNTPLGLPQLAPRGRGNSHVVSRQGQLEGGLTAGNIGGYEAELGARGTAAAAAAAAAARLSSSSHPCSSVPALWRSSDASRSCSSPPSGATAAGMITTAVSDASARAGAATVASAGPRCSKPGSDGNADSSAAGAAGERTVAAAAAAAVAAAASAAASANGGATTWTAPGSREGVPAWFGGGGGAGPITLPLPYGCTSRTDPGDGGGGGHRRSSLPPPPPAGGQWPRGPGGSSNSRSSSGIDGGSGGGLVGGASNGGGGGGGGGAKVASVAHASGAPSIRAGGSEESVGGGGGGGAQPRRATGRRGNELDFVWELGMLLDEDDAPGDVGRA